MYFLTTWSSKMCPFSSNHHHVIQHSMLLVLVLHLLLFLDVKAQPPSKHDLTMRGEDAVSNFQPSLAVVIGILCIMFALTFILLLYAKFCHRGSSVLRGGGGGGGGLRIQDGLLRSRSRFSGIDKNVIESLPYFSFSALKGSKEGLECSVCLSKYEDVEILRLLPKCKHAFHIGCIDQWLEKHSSCPLCRHKVSAEDLSILKDSTSMRFMFNNQSDLREESNLELYVEREEDRHGSSRKSFGSSFRKSEKGKSEDEFPIQQCTDDDDDAEDEDKKALHKFNHKIIISDVVFKHRWSNVSSSDLMFLSSEMLNDISSSRFSALDSNGEEPRGSRMIEEGEIMDIREEMERKRLVESKFKRKKQNSDSFSFPVLPRASESREDSGSSSSKILNPSEKRSMSEITIHPRFTEFNFRNNGKDSSSSSTLPENSLREERMLRLWLPIARRTVQWFADRERRPPSHTQNTTRQPSMV